MSEKTLLVEIEKEQKKMVEQKIALQKEKEHEKETEKALKTGKKINIFSSATFPKADPMLEIEKKEEEAEVAKIESKVSQVIEKPNYDLIETLPEEQHEKIFKVEKEEEKKAQVKFGKLKWIVLSVLLAIFGVWGIVNISTLDSLSSQVASVESTYSLNLIKYTNKLIALDGASAENMENLLPTIPDQQTEGSEIGQQTNWFDRVCNFIGGLFGG